MEVDKKQFNAMKQLTEISQGISILRSALDSLGDATNDYFKSMENETTNRVDKVLRESREALENTTQNHNQLSEYNKELTAYHNQIKDFTKTLTTLSQDFAKKMDESDKDMKEHHENISEMLKQIKIQRVNIEEDKKQLLREKKRIEEETRLLVDRRGALERGFKELQRLNNKK
jgi:isopenicillin N synthase-like dioxygenase